VTHVGTSSHREGDNRHPGNGEDKTMANITGNDSANTLKGTTGADTIKGLGGNDTIYGNSGDDVILGGSGNDTLYGDAGTDTVKGEDGNDIIKGGSGKSFLYGGNGDDTVFYDPTTSNIKAVGTYLSQSILKGEAGNDTLNVYNNAKVTVGGVEKASMTDAWVGDNGVTYLRFTQKDWDWDDTIIDVGTATGFETLKFSGSGGLNFQADLYGSSPSKVEGTAAADKFFGGYGNDTFTGGLGNDTFNMGGGADTVISGASDADSIYFSGWGGGTTTIKGFNGAGQQAGDKLYFDEYYLNNPDSQVKETNGNTVFTMNTGETVTVVGVTGMIEGVDWFV
jgi:Ca2+-binding RTX toxin-like protein